MTPEDAQELQAHIQGIANILYKNTNMTDLVSLEAIEKSVRQQMLEHVSPQVAFFFIKQVTGTQKGRARRLRSCVGIIPLTEKQAQRLELSLHSRISPLLKKCCLRVSANASYQKAEEEIEALTGMKVGHTALHRAVEKAEFSPPDAIAAVTEVSVDGGKARLRKETATGSQWLEYKAVRLQGIYYNAAFSDNQFLVDWVNSQKLVNPLVCLGDGHSGVWKLISELATSQTRQEILDWYHLCENLYKVGGSLKRLKQAKSYLWQGKTDKAIALFIDCRHKQACNFIAYLNKHRSRIINYEYYQAESLCSIGSGAVESAIKQIDLRLKLTGAQWKSTNVHQMLQLRCAYLNGQLAV